MLIAGTRRGSCMRNTICGVLGSLRSVPSSPCMTGAWKEKGRVSGPTSSTVSPAANLFRRLMVAMPSLPQSSTKAQICHWRIYRELSVYWPGKP